MKQPLPLLPSRVLLALYFGPNFPFKIRLWRGMHRLLGQPKFTVRYGPSGVLCLDINEFIQFVLLRDGKADGEVWDAIEPLLQAEDVLWDVGAHVGSLGIRAAQNPLVKQVVLFEPFPKMAECLKLNCARNPLLPLVPQAIALGDFNGPQQFSVPVGTNQGIGSLLFSHEDTIAVPVRRADDLIEQGIVPSPTIVKLDVEGAEPLVLAGKKQLFRRSPPRVIVFEGYRDYQNNPATQVCFTLLTAENYAIREIKVPVPDRIGNFIAVKN